MIKYYEVIGMIDGQKEILYGSFDRGDCIYEKDAEKDSWKDMGYKGIKIVSRETNDTPNEEVYKDQIVTKQELFMQQAPNFNFEYNADELLEIALEKGFITKINNEKYFINSEYN